MSKETIEELFAKIDDDNDGNITIEELTQLFKRFDKDGEYIDVLRDLSHIVCMLKPSTSIRVRFPVYSYHPQAVQSSHKRKAHPNTFTTPVAPEVTTYRITTQ